MACHLHSTYVGRVVLWSDVVVLKNTGGVEYVDKGLTRCIQCPCRVRHAIVHYRVVEVGVAIEVVVGILNLLHKPLGPV